MVRNSLFLQAVSEVSRELMCDIRILLKTHGWEGGELYRKTNVDLVKHVTNWRNEYGL